MLGILKIVVCLGLLDLAPLVRLWISGNPNICKLIYLGSWKLDMFLLDLDDWNFPQRRKKEVSWSQLNFLAIRVVYNIWMQVHDIFGYCLLCGLVVQPGRPLLANVCFGTFSRPLKFLKVKSWGRSISGG